MDTNQILDIVDLILCIVPISIIIGGILYYMLKEKREWNKGICPICGKSWKMGPIDCFGHFNYICDNGHICDEREGGKLNG